jgi:hypothetical protein
VWAVFGQKVLPPPRPFARHSTTKTPKTSQKPPQNHPKTTENTLRHPHRAKQPSKPPKKPPKPPAGTRSVQMLYRAVLFTFAPTALELVFVIAVLAARFSAVTAGLVAATFVLYVTWTLALTQVWGAFWGCGRLCRLACLGARVCLREWVCVIHVAWQCAMGVRPWLGAALPTPDAGGALAANALSPRRPDPRAPDHDAPPPPTERRRPTDPDPPDGGGGAQARQHARQPHHH